MPYFLMKIGHKTEIPGEVYFYMERLLEAKDAETAAAWAKAWRDEKNKAVHLVSGGDAVVLVEAWGERLMPVVRVTGPNYDDTVPGDFCAKLVLEDVTPDPPYLTWHCDYCGQDHQIIGGPRLCPVKIKREYNAAVDLQMKEIVGGAGKEDKAT